MPFEFGEALGQFHADEIPRLLRIYQDTLGEEGLVGKTLLDFETWASVTESNDPNTLLTPSGHVYREGAPVNTSELNVVERRRKGRYSTELWGHGGTMTLRLTDRHIPDSKLGSLLSVSNAALVSMESDAQALLRSGYRGKRIEYVMRVPQEDPTQLTIWNPEGMMIYRGDGLP